ncbi:MAG: AgmX/PglI C-terminal domain-containing protein [Myxococcales bacterium]|nr:AgmX/PglI C-terminal domain-containing protein [Myxococcales bacterium]MBK7196735.1 AgmX/PglI C-terminal domain-containing protein [Myxococcales bacterium]
MHIRLGRGGLIVALALVAACKGSGKGAGNGKGTPPAPQPTLAEQAPTMADPARLAGSDIGVPPVVVTIAADGALAVADAPTTPDAWAELTKAPRGKGQPIDLAAIGRLVHEATASGMPIEPMLADRKAAPAIDPAAALPGAVDDPPPPEPPDDLEGDDDEPGGDGTAMALDEGKMGKKDSDRTPGTYVMKRADPETLARDEALAAARSAGIVADLSGARGGGAEPGPDRDPAMPTRASQIVGRAVARRDRDPRALIVAAPTAKATALVDVIAAVGPSLVAVSHQRTLRALRVGFELDRVGFEAAPGDDRWIEVRIGADALTIEAVPAPPVIVPWASGPLDAAALAKAYDAAWAELGDAHARSVDVLVGPDTDVQRALDAVAALDGAGALAISLGRAPAPDSPEAAKRGKRIPRASAGPPQSVGDLDRAPIRRAVLERLPQIKACYERALVTTPDLAGTVSTQFFIAPNGTVMSANAAGVSPEVASCVAAIIKAIEFPKPRGGGGVQVNYPFTFRQ